MIITLVWIWLIRYDNNPSVSSCSRPGPHDGPYHFGPWLRQRLWHLRLGCAAEGQVYLKWGGLLRVLRHCPWLWLVVLLWRRLDQAQEVYLLHDWLQAQNKQCEMDIRTCMHGSWHNSGWLNPLGLSWNWTIHISTIKIVTLLTNWPVLQLSLPRIKLCNCTCVHFLSWS